MDATIAALAAGASVGLTGVTTKAVKDAYGGLMAALIGRARQLAVHIEALEARPDFQAKQSSLAEELVEVGGERDPRSGRAGPGSASCDRAGSAGGDRPWTLWWIRDGGVHGPDQ